MRRDIVISGFAWIGTNGPARGLPTLSDPSGPLLIDRWPTPGPRRAFLVPSFRPTDFVAGLRTRRMDRLSAWALLGSALALQDAGIELPLPGQDRTAVVFGTAFGCLDLTEEFLGAVATNALQAPPILFPETLANLPASHIARHFAIRGPNLTLSAGPLSGEAALLQAADLLETGEADRALVVSGDTVTRPLFEWYEAASLLAPGCFPGQSASRSTRRGAVVPGEGLAACVLETSGAASGRRRVHGRYHSGWLGSLSSDSGDPGSILREMLGGATPGEVALVGPPASGSWMATLADDPGRKGERDGPAVRPLSAPESGEFGGAGLLRVGVALARLPQTADGFVVVAGGANPCGQVAGVVVAREGEA